MLAFDIHMGSGFMGSTKLMLSQFILFGHKTRGFLGSQHILRKFIRTSPLTNRYSCTTYVKVTAPTSNATHHSHSIHELKDLWTTYNLICICRHSLSGSLRWRWSLRMRSCCVKNDLFSKLITYRIFFNCRCENWMITTAITQQGVLSIVYKHPLFPKSNSGVCLHMIQFDKEPDGNVCICGWKRLKVLILGRWSFKHDCDVIYCGCDIVRWLIVQ